MCEINLVKKKKSGNGGSYQANQCYNSAAEEKRKEVIEIIDDYTIRNACTLNNN
jgi:hypothetical protein